MASIFVDVVTGERVALTGDADVDERRLPRLRFLRADEPHAAEPLRACAFAPSASVRVDEPRGEVVLARSGAPDARHSIKKLFASLTKTALRDVRVECVPGTGPLAVVRATWDGGRALPIESVIAIDVDAQKVIGVAEGEPAHALDDGRLVVRAEHALTVFGAGGRKTEKHVLDGADLSPDGTRLVYVKERAVDEMYRPVFPYVRVLGQQEIPLDAPGDAATPHPASFVWPRVGPLAVTRCANSPVLPPEHEYCENPSFTLAGRTYDATDEAACAFVPRADGAPFQIACLDPRGPVHVDEPWDRSFVCRIGPHRLPLAVCARLLK